ncbi:translation initiation factor IF-2 [Aneurinibacillus aneurinilyticus]|jgi:translation initiation factor IF-2|uniref:translation initiation factor IF-2 n=1 Tax=Aneurinibacillus aneurinilyticus TaxID=1391 RepID=UPI0023F40C22|nr:translation initiation factor IF-2 [Aneurinibacillus aneurinilyticus]MCI1692438.1 translation initiation factor IF-2 [Aneurinibacillus aneurinilyticus]MED0669363.1 translation initiation factor IF-2 [Aneurinibacillus aneurinilyticus]
MSKLRVHEYAKELGISSKQMINLLAKLNLSVNNHMSTLEDSTIQKVEQHLKQVKQRADGQEQQKRDTEKSGKMEKKQEQNKSNVNNENRNTTGQGQRNNSQGQGSRSQGQGGRPQGQGGRPQGQGGRSQGQGGRPQGQGGRPQGQGNKPQGQGSKPQGQGGKPSRDNQSRGRGAQKPNNRSNRFDDKKKSAEMNKGIKRPHNKQQQQPRPEVKVDKITISGPMTVAELGKKMKKQPSEIIKKLFGLGVMATINQELEVDTIHLIAADYEIEVEEKIELDYSDFENIEEIDEPDTLEERPPVVTIMGHVDHGKTTLLDAIRETNVTSTEAGGITQHIGAYQVVRHSKKITFLDTPGHAAFTTMRARGAQVTDIAIIVVAADDGVMPQTVEAINHAKAAKVPIIVAVNKMDKPSANPDRVKQELTEHGLVPEDWGGDTIFVHVSALKREGLDDILEMILLVAEVQELKANPNKRARGTVIEAELDRGRGPVATILVQHGTLKIGDPIVVGTAFGRIRAMVNDKGRRIKEAPPSTPVEITGLNDVPQAGDQFMVFEDEKMARQVGERRSSSRREKELRASARVSLDDLFNQIKEGEMKDINVIIKGDVQGSVEALRGSLEKIDVEGVRVQIIHTGVGAITESDVILASASNAIIIGFNVRPEPNARVTAEAEKVDIRLHRIIYKVMEEIEAAMKGMLEPVYEEKVIGQAEVRQTFKVSRVGTIAGCYITDGKIQRDAGIRVIREGIVIYEGKIDALKRFKDDAREVAQGYECGITVEKYNDIKEGDVLEAFIMEEVAQ